MSPANIIGMTSLIGLDVIAITDHNSCKNCEPAMKLGRSAGILVIPGMELTTVEEVHVLCLFYNLEDALNFDSFVYSKLIKIENKVDIFGHQYKMDADDGILYEEPNLLINATTIPFSDVFDLLQTYNGIMIPAHIDKASNSVISNLGFIPPNSKFSCVEVKNLSSLHALQQKNPYLHSCNVITDSDAHALDQFSEPIHTLLVKTHSIQGVIDAIKSPLLQCEI